MLKARSFAALRMTRGVTRIGDRYQVVFCCRLGMNVYNSGAAGSSKRGCVAREGGGAKQRPDVLWQSMEMKGEFGHACAL